MTAGPHPPSARDLAQPLALSLAAALMMLPANVLPVLQTSLAGEARSDTIFSGIVALWDDGLWGIAAIVFVASIIIPVLKLLGLWWLLLTVHRARLVATRRRRTRIYAVLDFIGRWSMLDVFLVAFLAGTVQFGLLATVAPRPGIVAFATVVVLTILATDSFDARWLWLDAPEPAGGDGREPAPVRPRPTPA